MRKLFSWRKIAVVVLIAIGFLGLQMFLWLSTESAKACTLEYMGREVFSESQMTLQSDFYANGVGRRELRIPKFEEKFWMHSASFSWTDNPYIPPDENTKLTDLWVGTCTLTPKAPWSYLDIFGILGPINCTVYGDWRVETRR